MALRAPRRAGPPGLHVRSWIEASPVLIVRYEDLAARPGAVVGAMLDFLGLDRGPNAIERAIARNDRERMKRGCHRDAP